MQITENFRTFSTWKLFIYNNFDLLRNSRLSVSIYADRRELLVFRTFLAVSQRVEKGFSTRCKGRKPRRFPALLIHSSGRSRIVRLMRLRFSSTSSTITRTMSPTDTTSDG